MGNTLGNKLLQTPIRLSVLSWAESDQKETAVQRTLRQFPEFGEMFAIFLHAKNSSALSFSAHSFNDMLGRNMIYVYIYENHQSLNLYT